MKPSEVARRDLVRQSVEKAAVDLAAAEELFGRDRFREVVAFHCQQSAEKHLKAFLARHEVEFPKTHDIAKLLVRVAAVAPDLAGSLHDADTLTPFGVEHRYPSDIPELLPGGEAEAITIARQVRDRVMLLLQPYLDAR
jgi:HEPN domain-containing protein